LVVVAIIAVLAGLLFPVLASARAAARQVACLSNLRQMTLAYQLYLRDWDDRFVYWYLPAPNRPKPLLPNLYWTEFLHPYLRGDAVLRDPGARADSRDPNWLADYALATWGPGGQGTPEQPYFRWPGPPLSLEHVRRPSETIQWADGRCTTKGVIMDSWTGSGWARSGDLRHGRGSNVALVDGHARWLPAEEMRQVDTDGYGHYLRLGAADRGG
jgi:prepilin-type processing-associated H-X9-DG protein